MSEQLFAVYILTNEWHTVFYTGVAGNLPKRIFEHKEKLISGFTDRYNVKRLVYYETTENPESAIAREKQIKGWTRQKKITLIESKNPTWNDLSIDL